MARIRTIKPEFFTSEDIVSLTPLARLFYVSLWCQADREGRLEWKRNTLKMRCLPSDECDVEDLGRELVGGGLIVLYQHGGKTYAQILEFKKHQVINNREQNSEIPPPPVKSTSRVDDASLTRESGREGREGKGKEDASRGDSDEIEIDADASQAKTTRIGLLCKRIRQEAKLMGVNPHDPMLIALLEAGYTDEEIFIVCQEAQQKQRPWAWASKVIQSRKDDASKVKAIASESRASKFKGAI